MLLDGMDTDFDTRLFRQFFTRAQIARITGVDDSTLNYWMREGLLRAAEGGDGRGRHRRFGYKEITLAALLLELRDFGIGTPSLRLIAQHFHEAEDWMAARTITIENLPRIVSAWELRCDIVEHGYRKHHLLGQDDEAWFADHPKHHNRFSEWVELDWEQALVHRFRSVPEVERKGRLTPTEKALLTSWTSPADIAQFARMQLYFVALTKVRLRKPPPDDDADVYYFCKDMDGDWHLTQALKAGGHGASFIGIDMALLTYRIWVEGRPKATP